MYAIVGSCSKGIGKTQQMCFLRFFHIFTVLRKKLSSVKPIVPLEKLGKNFFFVT